jgi:membrane associated rhomboid family serine protease
VFVAQLATHGLLEHWFALQPLQPVYGVVLFHVWQLVTYAFLHSTENLAHLLFNMVALWMFGRPVENAVGPRRLLTCYFAAVITAALTQLFVPGILGAPPAPVVGASGGVFGLILACAVLFPYAKVFVFFVPIGVPMWLFAAGYAGVELYLGVTGRLADVAHFAHLGGLIGAALVIFQWRWTARSRSPRRRG